MNKYVLVIVCGLLGLLIGGAAEFIRNQLFVIPGVMTRMAEQADTSDDSAAHVVRVMDESAQNEVILLRKQIEDLEARLNGEQRAERQPPPGPAEDNPTEPQIAEARRMSRTNQFSRFRSQMTPEQREERRFAAEQSMAEHYSFLENIDQKNMDQVQRENHAKLLEKVAQMNELRNALVASNERPTAETFQLLRATEDELRELYAAERQYMLQALGRNTGLGTDQSAAFAEQIQTIYQNTSMPRFGGHHGPR